MRKTQLFSLILTIGFLGASAQANTQLITYTRNSDSSQASMGFSDSSFDYSQQKGQAPDTKTMCFMGKIEGVCQQISDTASAMNNNYRRGAHDAMTLNSCTIKADSVEVSYDLTDDYGGDLQVQRSISRCN